MEQDHPGEQFEPETPFLDTRYETEAWLEREGPPGALLLERQWAPQVETPFLTEFHGQATVNFEAQ